MDRGSFSIEILLYLYCLKLAHPTQIMLLRGNHESRQMSQFFNFRDECICKHNVEIFEAFMQSFTTLPLAAIVDNKFLCLHGGISPDLHTISQLFTIDRFIEPPCEGLFCDVLWADPQPESDSVDQHLEPHFQPNEARGCSYTYSHEATCEFLNANKLSALIRAHEVQVEGFRMSQLNPASGFPSTITVFSAPNYCDLYGNKGAIINIAGGEMDVVQFDAAPHPYTLPSFMNVFNWSIPFVAEKVTELVQSIIHTNGGDSSASRSPQVATGHASPTLSPRASSAELAVQLQDRMDSKVESANAIRRLKTKMRSVAKLLTVMRTVRGDRSDSPPPQHTQESPRFTPVALDVIPRRRSSFAEILQADIFTEKRRPSSPTSSPR